MKRIFVFLPLLILVSCGFRPMYGSHSASAQKTEAGTAMSDIEIAIVPDREGQILRNDLIDALYINGTPQNPRYKLTFSELVISLRELDLTKSSEATRSQVIAATTIFLIDLETGETVLARPVKSISSYNILPSEFATNVTEDNARSNALKDLSRQIQVQLSLYFNR